MADVSVIFGGTYTAADHPFLKNIPPEDDPDDLDYQPSTVEFTDDESQTLEPSQGSAGTMLSTPVKKRKHTKALPRPGNAFRRRKTEKVKYGGDRELLEGRSHSVVHSQRSTDSSLPSPPTSPNMTSTSGNTNAIQGSSTPRRRSVTSLARTPPRSPGDMTESSHNNSLFNEKLGSCPQDVASNLNEFALPHRSATLEHHLLPAPIARMYSTKSPSVAPITPPTTEHRRKKRTRSNLRPKERVTGQSKGKNQRIIGQNAAGTVIHLHIISDDEASPETLTAPRSKSNTAVADRTPSTSTACNKDHSPPGLSSQATQSTITRGSFGSPAEATIWNRPSASKRNLENPGSSSRRDSNASHAAGRSCSVCGETFPTHMLKVKHKFVHKEDFQRGGSVPAVDQVAQSTMDVASSHDPDDFDDPFDIYRASPRPSIVNSVRAQSELWATANPIIESILNPLPTVEGEEDNPENSGWLAHPNDDCAPSLDFREAPDASTKSNHSATLEPEIGQSMFVTPDPMSSHETRRHRTTASETLALVRSMRDQYPKSSPYRERSMTLDHGRSSGPYRSGTLSDVTKEKDDCPSRDTIAGPRSSTFSVIGVENRDEALIQRVQALKGRRNTLAVLKADQEKDMQDKQQKIENIRNVISGGHEIYRTPTRNEDASRAELMREATRKIESEVLSAELEEFQTCQRELARIGELFVEDDQELARLKTEMRSQMASNAASTLRLQAAVELANFEGVNS